LGLFHPENRTHEVDAPNMMARRLRSGGPGRQEMSGEQG
jgi:hypothetical protein